MTSRQTKFQWRRRSFFEGVPTLFLIIYASVSTALAQGPSNFQQHAALFNMKCAKCHTVGSGDRVGPDLRGVMSRHDPDWILKFIMNPDAFLDSDPVAKQLRAKYNGVRMENTHLTRAEAEGIIEYLKAAGSSPVAPEAPEVVPEEPLFAKLPMPDEGYSVSPTGVLILLLLFLLGGWLWQTGTASGVIGVSIVALLVGYLTFGGRRYYHLLGNEQGYEPLQPIAFSHALHAGKLGISCLYCHHGAEKSDVAGIPSVNICMNCHVAVRKTSDEKEPSAEIAKVVDAWETRSSTAPRSIGWIRVHELPDFAHFSHRVHVNNNIQCQECHGPGQTMARMRQAASLSMGWCVNCHRKKPGEAPTHWKHTGGPLDCAACHW